MSYTIHGNPEVERVLRHMACKDPRPPSSIIHAADTSYDRNGYGDSYIPLCIGPGYSTRVTYSVKDVTCKRCKKKLRV